MRNNNFNEASSKLPSDYAYSKGNKYASLTTPEYKKKLGQYITPQSIGSFMGGLFMSKKGRIKILEPGAGTGILACAAIESLALSDNKLKEVYLTVYEVDKEIIPYLKDSLEYLKKWLNKQKIIFIYEIKVKDFLLDNADILNDNPKLFPAENDHYDFIISNPPYFKLLKTDPRTKSAMNVVHGQPNIYALFMAVSAALLNLDGEMVFITPRSYAAGPYFRLFREKFFSIIRPTYIHLFGSRIDAFDKDDVLQENIILKAVKDDAFRNKDTSVTISFSKGIIDLSNLTKRKVPLSEVVDFNSKNKVIRIPVSKDEDEVVRLIHAWKYSLAKYNIKISTGPVVPFRANGNINGEKKNDANYVPLLWLQNVKPMSVTWPLDNRKHQYIKDNEKTRSILVKNNNYVLLRRFSTKEEDRRLVAAPYLSDAIDNEKIGIENHVNYIYKTNGSLSEEEAYGIAALLNSKLIDTYFRTSNGNTQVSATELRDMPFPSPEIIAILGQKIIKENIKNGQLDSIVEKTLAINGKI